MILKRRFVCGLEMDDDDAIDENMTLTLFLAQKSTANAELTATTTHPPTRTHMHRR